MLDNKTLALALISWFCAQFFKVVFNFIKTNKINLSLFFSAGGMPSSHSAFVTSMTFSIALNNGFSSDLFAVCLIMSLIVMYDAAGVRRAAGKQAAVINIILEQIEKQGIKIDTQLKELLGHSPIEVIGGAFLGFIITCFNFIINFYF
ncbi:MAG: divergent PAP2 family protein [Clostridiales bacterium]|jgi:acid phosphatase family membrane protein YuiD|nr:divergent PAP2 family protein [Clostridiales bacterium]